MEDIASLKHCIVKKCEHRPPLNAPPPPCPSPPSFMYIFFDALSQSVLIIANIFNQFKKQNTFLAISDCHSAHYATLSWAEKLKKYEKLPKKLWRYVPTKGNQ